MTPMKAIRLKCLDCCCGSSQEVSECDMTDCALHYYRHGHNPKRRGMGGNTEKAREAKKAAVGPTIFGPESLFKGNHG